MIILLGEIAVENTGKLGPSPTRGPSWANQTPTTTGFNLSSGNKETPSGSDIRFLHGIRIHCGVCIKPVGDPEFVQIVSVESLSILLRVIAVFERICQVNDAQNAKGAVRALARTMVERNCLNDGL